MQLPIRVRRTEYLGDNRCIPCTLTNLVLVAIFAGIAGLVNQLLGVLVIIMGVAAIWLRGYVVPYMPTFAPRVINVLPFGRRFFAHDRDLSATGLSDGDPDGERMFTLLAEADVLCGATELELAPEFRREWKKAIDDLRSNGVVTAVEDTAPHADQARLHEDGDQAWVIVNDDERSIASERWLPLPIALADVAAVQTLTDRGISARDARNAAPPLRLFLDECPACGSELVETTAGSCCGGFGPSGPDRVLACADSDQQVASLED